MYNNISQAAKNALKASAVTTTARITIVGTNQVIDGNNLCSVTIKDFCYSDGALIGTTMCKEVEIELINNNYNLVDKEFSLEVGVLLPNNTYEYIPYGNFIVKEYQDLKSNNKYKIVANDYMDKLNQEFKDDYDYANPITLQQFYQNFATFYGITLETQSNLPNASFSITQKPYFDGMSGRVVLSRIAEMMGSFAKFNRTNKLQMYLQTTTSEQISRSEMNTKLERNELYGPVNVVSLELGQVEGENVTLRDEASIAQYGENIIKITDNPFTYTEALRTAAITPIYNRLHNFQYYPTSFNAKLIYLDCGDVVSVQDMETDTYYSTMILNQTLQIPSTRQSKFENLALTKTGLLHQFVPKEKQVNNRTEFLVDKANKQIELVVEETIPDIEEEIQTIVDTTGTAQGKYIHIEDSAEQPLISLELDGETSQETRSGKNLFNKNSSNIILGYRVDTIGGIYADNNYYVSEFIPIIGGTTYTKNSPSADAYHRFAFYSTNNTSGFISISSNNTEVAPINATYLRFCGLQAELDTTQLEQGSATPYEPYGVMPSPDYPSEIKNVSGRNFFDLNTKKDNTLLSWARGVEVTENKSIVGDYEDITNLHRLYSNYKFYIFFYDNNKSYLGNSETLTTENGIEYSSNPINIDNVKILNSNVKYCRVEYRSGTNSNQDMTLKTDIMLCRTLEETQTDYVPYDNIVVKVEGKNLFDEEVLLGYYSSTGVFTSANNQLCAKNLIKVSPNNNYWLGIKLTLTSNISVVLYDKNKNFIRRESFECSPNGTIYTTDSNTYYIKINFGSLYIGGATYNHDIIIAKGSTPTTYEAYKSQTAFFPLHGQKLMEGSYLADDGVHHKRKQVVLDGTENWVLEHTLTNVVGFRITQYTNVKINANCVSDYFKKSTYRTDKEGIVCTPFQASVILIYINKDRLSELNVNAFKSWISTHNTTVEYELKEEEIIPYTTDQQEAWYKLLSLNTYKNVSNITSDAYAKIEYAKDNGLDIYETKSYALTKYSQIELTTDKINLEVSQKLNTGEFNHAQIVAKINDNTSQVLIDANKINLTATDIINLLAGNTINLTSKNIVIDSTNFKVTKEGNITATGGTIGGFTLSNIEFSSNITFNQTYTSTDTDRIREIIMGNIVPTSADYEKYDLTRDGRIDILDYYWVARFVAGTATTNGVFKINTIDSRKSLELRSTYDNKIQLSLGLFGSFFKTLSCDNFQCNGSPSIDGNVGIYPKNPTTGNSGEYEVSIGSFLEDNTKNKYGIQIIPTSNTSNHIFGKADIGYILYDNVSGTSGTVTLAETSANFDYIEIYYKSSYGYRQSVKIENPNGKVAQLSWQQVFGGTSNTVVTETKIVLISGTTIATSGTNDQYGQWWSWDNSINNVNNIYITKVVGYK